MPVSDAQIHELLRQWRAVMALQRPRWHSDLTITQLRALATIGRRQPVRVSDVAEDLGAAVAATSALVDRMAKHGLVSRSNDPEDRRIVLLELTPRARRLLDRIEQGSTDHLARLMERMTPAEREAFVTTLRAFVRLSAEQVLEKREHGLVAVRRGSD